jgi:hypothetical protein
MTHNGLMTLATIGLLLVLCFFYNEFIDDYRFVRRYSPPLTKRQLDLLIFLPPDASGIVVSDETYVLKRFGLVTPHPHVRGRFIVTKAGADVVRRWKSAGWA